MFAFSIYTGIAVCCIAFFFVSVLFLGKNCELCTSGFFRLEDSNPTSLDVCRQCNCHTAGTVNGSETCAQVHTTQYTYTHTHLLTSPFIRYTLLVLDLTPFSHYFNLFAPDSFHLCFIFQVGGQCRCKIAVTGRQCSQCLPGWYGLEASNPEGCTRCNCTDVGIASNSSGVPTCNQDTGQCRCKAHVIGRKTSGKEF